MLDPFMEQLFGDEPKQLSFAEIASEMKRPISPAVRAMLSEEGNRDPIELALEKVRLGLPAESDGGEFFAKRASGAARVEKLASGWTNEYDAGGNLMRGYTDEGARTTMLSL
ncbi:MAG TPA: hypothetical protein VLX32_04730 [Candidatus Acidoferrum sp.]|nr:hypothetical protein [Candidatus Acidoferrum sp.]